MDPSVAGKFERGLGLFEEAPWSLVEDLLEPPLGAKVE